MRVLSIDWDYFIDATAHERGVLFPDGGNENLSATLQNAIWLGRYLPVSHPRNNPMPQLAEIKLDLGEYTTLRMMLKRVMTHDTKAVIADSHRYAYDAVVETYAHRHSPNLNLEPIELINIDFHHDCYFSHEDNRPVDCGNWLWKLIQKYEDRLQATWVRRSDSDPWELGELDPGTISGIDTRIPFDLVFLCRSGMWSPPHLDRHFISLAKWLMKNTENWELKENWVTANRYTRPFQDAVAASERTKQQLWGGFNPRPTENLMAPPSVMGGETK